MLNEKGEGKEKALPSGVENKNFFFHLRYVFLLAGFQSEAENGVMTAGESVTECKDS